MTLLRVRALIFQDDHFLLARFQPTGAVFFPGGRVEAGETLLAALAREIFEETRGVLVGQEYLGAIEAKWELQGKPMHDLSHFFAARCEGLSCTVTPCCNDEGIELFWVPRTEISQCAFAPPVLLPHIQAWLRGERKIWWEFVAE